MGNKLVSVATTDSHPPLGNALKKIGRVWHTMADIDQAKSIGECVILGDSLGYQGLNARSAKETLQQRTAVLEEYQSAVKTAISKRRGIERLKASSNIRPEKVDEALEDLEEVGTHTHLSWVLPNEYHRPTSMNKSSPGGQTGFRRTYTGRWNDTIDWLTMTLPLPSSSTSVRPSCTNAKFSRSWRHFGRISVALLIRWYHNPMESQNLPLFHH